MLSKVAEKLLLRDKVIDKSKPRDGPAVETLKRQP